MDQRDENNRGTQMTYEEFREQTYQALEDRREAHWQARRKRLPSYDAQAVPTEVAIEDYTKPIPAEPDGFTVSYWTYREMCRAFYEQRCSTIYLDHRGKMSFFGLPVVERYGLHSFDITITPEMES